MKRHLLILAAAALLLSLPSGCSTVPEESRTSCEASAAAESSVAENNGELSGAESSAESSGQPEPAEETASENTGRCGAHSFSFHSISAELMEAVGKEEALQWAEGMTRGSSDPYGRRGEDMTILAFIEEFDIPKDIFTELTQGTVTDDFLETLSMTREEYYAEFGYTDGQIEALYSGNPKQVECAFCGPLAFLNEVDGKVYSIYWLAEHSAQEYLDAQLSLGRVDQILQTANSGEYGEFGDWVEKITPILEEARTLAAE